jgi:hypothetical protein
MIRTGEEYRESIRDGREAANIKARVLQKNQTVFLGTAAASVMKKGVGYAYA